MSKKQIRLIGLDLDGTTLKDDKTISDSTKEYLNALGEKGLYILPITGRPIKGVPDFIRNLSGVEYIITSNGAQIIDNRKNEPLFSFALSNEESVKIIKAVMKYGCLFEAFCDGVGYCSEEGHQYYKKTYTGTPIGEYVFSSRIKVESILALFEGTNKEADEILVFCDDSKQRDKMNNELCSIEGIEICYLSDRMLEITKKGTNKGNALRAICNHLEIELEETIAFGDGENDLEFLKAAGTSVAMGNAVECVKKNADIIADTNENDGVIKVLKEMIE